MVGWTDGLGQTLSSPHDHPRNLISSSLFRNGGCGGRPCQPKNVHRYLTRVLTTRTYTRQRFPPSLIAPTKNGKEIRWETLIVESFFISFFGVARLSLSLSPSSDLEIDDV